MKYDSIMRIKHQLLLIILFYILAITTSANEIDIKSSRVFNINNNLGMVLDKTYRR